MVNPKTQAVLDAFLDFSAPENLRVARRSELRELRPKLFKALEELVEAVGPLKMNTEEEAEKVFNEL